MQIYKVGGAVRDRLLGQPVSDIDWLVVGATVEQMLAQGFRPVGDDFPVFLHPQTGDEYALARTERKSGQGYGGFTFFASPAASATSKRACCAMCPRPSPKIRCACCASPALPRATPLWAFA